MKRAKPCEPSSEGPSPADQLPKRQKKIGVSEEPLCMLVDIPNDLGDLRRIISHLNLDNTHNGRRAPLDFKWLGVQILVNICKENGIDYSEDHFPDHKTAYEKYVNWIRNAKNNGVDVRMKRYVLRPSLTIYNDVGLKINIFDLKTKRSMSMSEAYRKFGANFSKGSLKTIPYFIVSVLNKNRNYIPLDSPYKFRELDGNSAFSKGFRGDNGLGMSLARLSSEMLDKDRDFLIKMLNALSICQKDKPGKSFKATAKLMNEVIENVNASSKTILKMIAFVEKKLAGEPYVNERLFDNVRQSFVSIDSITKKTSALSELFTVQENYHLTVHKMKTALVAPDQSPISFLESSDYKGDAFRYKMDDLVTYFQTEIALTRVFPNRIFISVNSVSEWDFGAINFSIEIKTSGSANTPYEMDSTIIYVSAFILRRIVGRTLVAIGLGNEMINNVNMVASSSKIGKGHHRKCSIDVRFERNSQRTLIDIPAGSNGYPVAHDCTDDCLESYKHCIICAENFAEVKFFPCEHISYCVECFNKHVGSLEGEVAQDCPMCRSVIGHLQLVDKQKD